MATNNNNTNQTTADKNASSFSLLIEAAGTGREAAGVTNRRSADSSTRNAAHAGAAGAASAAVDSSAAPGRAESDLTDSGDSGGDSPNIQLNMLALAAVPEPVVPEAAKVPHSPVAVAVAAVISKPAAPLEEPPAKKTNSKETNESAAEAKRKRAALTEAAKSLSDDPLVQLSMMRAMEQLNVAPDLVKKNKEDLEKAAQAKQQKASKKRKGASSGVLASGKAQKKQYKQRLPKRMHAVSSLVTTAPASQPHSMTSKTPRFTFQAESIGEATGMENLLAGRQHSSSLGHTQHQSAAGGSDPGLVTGTLAFVQSLLLSVVQNNQTNLHQSQVVPVAPVQALQAANRSGNSAHIMDLLQSLNIVIPGQQSNPPQGLVPQLGNDTSKEAANPTNNTMGRSSFMSSTQKEGSCGRDQQIRIPCRARGMPPDHNFQTSHFIVPQGIKHGQDLVCSYPACRDGGVKFRYCLFCRIPVAKRNFRLRHSHVDTESQPPEANEMQIPSTICVDMDSSSRNNEEETSSARAHAAAYSNNMEDEHADRAVALSDRRDSKKKKKRKESSKHHNRHPHESKSQRLSNEEAAHLSSSNKQLERASIAMGGQEPVLSSHAIVEPCRAVGPTLKRGDNDKNKKKHKNNSSKHAERHANSTDHKPNAHQSNTERRPESDAHDNSQNHKKVAAKEHMLKNISEKRLYMWSSLLGKRPRKDDEDNMSRWLMNVLATSDPNAPL